MCPCDQMKGRVHSVQSLGAVDGPGLRYVVFLQGCPLRCAYCHNPDTWAFDGGEEREAGDLVRQVLRYRPYFGEKGGVTVSGGEPLSQPAFVEELFRLLHAEGVHTALDTSGTGDPQAVRRVLAHTDLALLDLKFPTAEGYRVHCRGELSAAQRFAALAAEANVPLWVRHVVAPGLNDTVEDLRAVKSMAESWTGLQKIEWLPFHNLCLEKYRAMGVPFPLEGTPPMSEKRLEELLSQL